MRKKIETGEWEVDKSGNRFRRVGKSIEYAPVITVCSVEEIQEEQPKTKISCPLFSVCNETCAFYGENGCGLVTGNPPTTGKHCPFSIRTNFHFNCNENCALWALCGKEAK